MTNKRGQAALEFLSTYGFAFLIILVMVGALTYFGVLNPQGFVPSRCSAAESFGCDENIIFKNPAGTNATIYVVVKNTKTVSIDFLPRNATAEGYGAITAAAQCVTIPAAATAIPPGNTVTFACNIAGGYPNGAGASAFPAAGQKIKVALDFQYRETGNTYYNTARVDVINNLQ